MATRTSRTKDSCTKTAPHDAAGDLDRAVATTIAACDGDLRDTIRALVVTTSFLHGELERCRSLISRGFTRGKLLDLP